MYWLIATGGGIGFLSGVVGIGGGIFLAPILYLKRWGTAREIAAACTVFILCNSVSGLLGQLMKLRELSVAQDVVAYWPLLIAVFFGGQIGSRLASGPLTATIMKRLTGVLTLYVAGRLLWRLTTQLV